MTIVQPFLVILAAALLAMAPVDAPARRVPDAAVWTRTLDLVPASAISVVAMPIPKMAADDLAECLASLGEGGAALPMRPIDLFKSRVGLGGGIDETGPFVMWFETQDGVPSPAMLVSVTGADEFLQSNFEKVDTPEGTAWKHAELGTLHARSLDRRVLLSTSRRIVDAYAERPGMADALKARLGEKGFSVLTSGDLAAWGGAEALAQARRQAESMRGGRASGAGTRPSADGRSPRAARKVAASGDLAKADLDGSGAVDAGDMGELLLRMGEKSDRGDLDGDGTITQADARRLQAILDAGAEPSPEGTAEAAATVSEAGPDDGRTDPAEGVIEGVLSVDFDPLGVASRTWAVMDPASPMGRATRGGPAGEPARLRHLPPGPFVLAMAADLRGVGGVDAFADLLAMAPEAPSLPEWIVQNKDLVSQVEFAIYPSKLGVAGGGLLNEACLWLRTSDSKKARELMKAWMNGLSGTRDGLETKVVWEEGKAVKDGTVVDAWSVTQQPGSGGKARPNPMRRLAQSLVFGPRGAMGFVKTFPDGLLITFSQRPDVLRRCIEAIEGEKRLEGNATIAALRGWLLPDADIEAFVGVGSLMGVVRQAASSIPGGGIELPDAPPSLEPVALAMQVQDGRVETAAMVPAGVIGVMAELYRMRMQPGEADDAAADPEAAEEDREP